VLERINASLIDLKDKQDIFPTDGEMRMSDIKINGR